MSVSSLRCVQEPCSGASVTAEAGLPGFCAKAAAPEEGCSRGDGTERGRPKPSRSRGLLTDSHLLDSVPRKYLILEAAGSMAFCEIEYT